MNDRAQSAHATAAGDRVAAPRHGIRFLALKLRRCAEATDPRLFERLGYAGLLVLSLFAFIYGVGGYGIINGNESLYVEAALEMARSGAWAVPTLDGLPYLEKPPLFIWLLRAASAMGGPIEVPPRLVTASAALLLIAGVARFAVLLKVGTRGFTAAFILVTTLGIDIMSRVAMPDLLLTTLFALACFGFLAALQHKRVSYLRLAGGLLGAASLVKGVLPLALFALVVAAFYGLEPARRSDIRKVLRDPLAAALMVLPLGLWLIAIESALPGAASWFIVDEHVLRFLGRREPHDYYSGSPLYYVPRLFVFFFPWAGALLFGWLAGSRRVEPERRQIRRFLWLCVWIPFGFFTLSSAKANYYIVLCLPAMALLTADYLPDLLRERRRVHLLMAVVVPILAFVVLWAYRVWRIGSGATPPLLPVRDGSGPLTIAVLVALSLVVAMLIVAGWRRAAVLCLGGLIAPVSLQFDHLVARAEPFMSARTMAALIRDYHPGARVYLYQDFEAFGALPIYLGHTVPVIDSRSNDLYFGHRVRPDHESLVGVDQISASAADVLIVVMDDRQNDFARSSLAERATELTKIGRARLYLWKAAP